jgi:hypothetical protein
MGALMDFAVTILQRLPFERWLVKAPPKVDPWDRLEKIISHSEAPLQEAKPVDVGIGVKPDVSKEISAPRPGLTRPQHAPKRKYGVGCQPCTADHLATCAGALSEAIRFARSDGMGSIEVQERLALCAEEMNIWERRDAAPKSFVSLPPEDKEFLRRWLPKGRSFRHRVNQVVSIEDLEGVAAEGQKLHLELRKELREKANPLFQELGRQADRIEAGEINEAQALKELESWQSARS